MSIGVINSFMTTLLVSLLAAGMLLAAPGDRPSCQSIYPLRGMGPFSIAAAAALFLLFAAAAFGAGADGRRIDSRSR